MFNHKIYNMNKRQKKIALRAIMTVGGFIITMCILGIDYEEASKIPRQGGRR